jgi:hypothetical protein
MNPDINPFELLSGYVNPIEYQHTKILTNSIHSICRILQPLFRTLLRSFATNWSVHRVSATEEVKDKLRELLVEFLNIQYDIF